jgi:ribosomal protein L3 glutamine methyltransferase
MSAPDTGCLGTVRDLIRHAVSRFGAAPLFYGHGQPDAFDEACFLVVRRLRLPLERTDFFLDARLSREEIDDLAGLIEQRVARRVPVAYLLGEAWLQGYRFRVDPRVIVPRSFIAELLKDGMAPWVEDPEAVGSVLDLCTGSGCLAIIAADCFPGARVDGVDLSAPALEVAALNVGDYGLEARVRLLRSDLFEAVAGRRYDLILCNPPYVTDEAMAALPEEYRHEPRTALAAGPQGLDVVARVLAAARRHLAPGGLLAVEVGDGRAQVEAAWPGLPFVWATTSGGDGMVFVLGESDLPR